MLVISETWTMAPRDRSRLQAAEMIFLRPLVAVTKRDRIKSKKLKDNYIYNLKGNFD
jgi:hypothetical protein